jgi:hypothetical protein
VATIERILELHKQLDYDKDTLSMIISNRMDYYIPEIESGAVTAKNWNVLIEDILSFIEFKSKNK